MLKKIGLIALLFSCVLSCEPQTKKTDDPMEESKKSEVNASGSIQLFLCGDVMSGRGIDQALPHSVDPVLYESYVKNAKEYLYLAERENGLLPNRWHMNISGEML